ncbi:MAG: M28 family peptidase [Gemmataceae bacterium]
MVRLAVGLVLLIAAGLSIGWTLFQRASSEPADSGFAADRDPKSVFDAERSMKYLKDICAIGPRISATDGMAKQQDMLKKHFEALGGTVTLQKFTAKQVSQKQPVEMANMIVSWNPQAKRRYIICSHYDTRPIADQEDDPRNWTKPFVSANDGGSGVALMMELAHHMKDLDLKIGVDFVLFDGEEYIFERGDDVYFFGSKHFAKNIRKERPGQQFVAAILLDMIAGKQPRFLIEQNSMMRAGRLVESVWGLANQIGIREFENQRGFEISDDHVALNANGIPAIDIIDFNYMEGPNPHWHRLSDTPENCSGESMQKVARVLIAWLKRQS